MKVILSIFSVFFIISTANSQLINKKLNIHVNYNIGDFMGKDFSNDNGFVYPYLYSNMTKLNGYSFKATCKIHSLFSAGLEGGEMTGTNWSAENNILYEGAKVNLKSISPVFQIHTRYNETGLYNRLKIYGEVAPVFGQSKLQLQKPIFEINSSSESENLFLESVDSYFGIKGGAGVEFAFSKEAGINLSYSVQQNFISSAFYNDEDFLHSQLSIGLYFRLFYDKRFAY
jgi:opacity protein-like surface antigen